MTKLSPKGASKEAADKHPSANWSLCIIISLFIIALTSIIGLIIWKLSFGELTECMSSIAIYVAGMGTIPTGSLILKGLVQIFKD